MVWSYDYYKLINIMTQKFKIPIITKSNYIVNFSTWAVFPQQVSFILPGRGPSLMLSV